MEVSKRLNSSTFVPNLKYPRWANARTIIKNMTAKPSRSFAHALSVVDSWVIVLLKLMYLKICFENAQGYVCMYVFMYVCMYEFMHLCMRVCIYVCIYAFMYVCM